MKEMLRLLCALTLISSAAGLLLAYTNKVTAMPIAEAGQNETTLALKAVLPDFDNNPLTTTCVINESNRIWKFHVARKSGAFSGAAFETSSSKGYGGEIAVMIGVTAKGAVKNIRILSQHETPGLGTKVAEDLFRRQFDNRPIEGTTWAVTKDNGSFDAVTGATISSRAVLEAVRTGLDAYWRHKDEIARTGE